MHNLVLFINAFIFLVISGFLTLPTETALAFSHPAIALERSINGGSSWSGTNATITGNQQVQFRWSSTNAVSCPGWTDSVGSDGFHTSDFPNGSDSSVAEPLGGATYGVTCNGPGGSSSDSITITRAYIPHHYSRKNNSCVG